MVGVAVQEHDRRSGRLAGEQEIVQQRGVGPVQPGVGVPVAGVQLHRQPGVQRGPDQLADQHLILDAGAEQAAAYHRSAAARTSAGPGRAG